jgi:hypothetical protein
MSYAHISVKDHNKATIYNYAYKYNSNKCGYKFYSLTLLMVHTNTIAIAHRSIVHKNTINP